MTHEEINKILSKCDVVKSAVDNGFEITVKRMPGDAYGIAMTKGILASAVYLNPVEVHHIVGVFLPGALFGMCMSSEKEAIAKVYKPDEALFLDYFMNITHSALLDYTHDMSTINGGKGDESK